MHDNLDRYRSLPTPLQRALQLVYERQGKIGQGSPERLLEILDSLTAWQMLTDRWIDKIPCYSYSGHTIRLLSFLKSSKSAKVLTGIIEGPYPREVVVKYVASKKHTIDDEIDHYRRLDKMGCFLPWYSDEFFYWGARVLVVEKLEPLGPYDDEYRVGRHILRQLRYLHRYGCHSDIKPLNIMKRRKKRGKGRYEYFLIDYGGVATVPLKEGYKRWIWTEKWSSQEPHAKNQVITPTQDFIELAYVMRAIQNWREQAPNKRDKYNDGDFKDLKYRGRLKKFVNLVNKGCVDHKELIDALKG
jgi:serine/threonine protein kinase